MISRTVCDRFKHRPQRYRNSVLAAWNSVRVQQKKHAQDGSRFCFFWFFFSFFFFLTEKNGGKKKEKKKKRWANSSMWRLYHRSHYKLERENSHQFLLRWVPIFPLVRSALYLCAKTQTTTVVSMLMCISFSFFFFKKLLVFFLCGGSQFPFLPCGLKGIWEKPKRRN